LLPLLLAVQLVTPPTPDVRLNTLDAWLQAVAQHEPGTVDPAALRVREMQRLTLDWVRRDLQAVLTLMRDPKASIFYDEPNPRFPHRRPGVLVYTRVELETLRAFAFRAKALGNRNDVLKRGVLLHTDVAILAPADAGPVNGRRRDGQVSVQLDDARQLGLQDVVSHFDIARRLLDLITTHPDKNEPANPASDEDVRLWYAATAAFMINYQKFDLDHFPRASQLFPSDPDIQFLVGGFHASMAAPRWQIGLQRADLGGVELDVRSERDELRLAEAAFRRAASGRNAPEARLRLGRVLGLQGRAVDAVKELRAALPGLTNPLLIYYAQLFLGRELETLNQVAGAQAAYQHAAELYPHAQAPRLALSQLAVRAGDRQVAVTESRRAFGATDDHDDPWWSYDVSAGRAAAIVFERMWKAFPGPR